MNQAEARNPIDSMRNGYQVEALAQKIRHYLITNMGVTLDKANDEEFFRAFSFTLREELMINWIATIQSMQHTRPRTLYYLCMEYMPGRLLENSICNIHAQDLMKAVAQKLGRDYQKILHVERDPGLGNGGLGRLASCLLDSLATKQYPAFAYGLRYQYGIFEQEIWDGEQVERPDRWLDSENPWEFRCDANATNLYYAGRIIPVKNKQGVEVYELADFEEVRALPYDIPIVGYRETPDFSVLSLRLWTTKESPRNFQLQRYNAGLLDQAAENTTLTDVLYPSDDTEFGKRIRLKQEYLLVAASIQDILANYKRQFPDMSSFSDKVRIHLNDTHAALTIAELTHILLKDYDFAWGEAFEVVRTCCNYTNHTVLRESLEEWNENRVGYLLPRQYRIIQRLNEDFCTSIRKKYPGDEKKVQNVSIIQGGQIKMAHLAIYGSHRVNGVAKLHTEILEKEVFRDFYELDSSKFVNVTNGITQRYWLYQANPKLADFLIRWIGKGWITDLLQLQELSKYANDCDAQREFLQIKKANKRTLIAFLKHRNPLRNAQGHIIGTTEPLDENALYDVQIKRLHEYKRQFMNALHLLILYQELIENPNSRKIKRMVFFGGKAAPSYLHAKGIIRLIFCLERKINHDQRVNQSLRVLFLENYNASRALRIIPAADLSEQISCAGTEASGSGNMKLALNGALTIGTEDGANIEMHQKITDQWWPFQFGAAAQENILLRTNHQYNPWEIYMKNPKIKSALDALKNRSLVETDAEHAILSMLFDTLLAHNSSSDYYFVLRDLESYYEMQKKVEDLYSQPLLWAETALQNIAHMGHFSTDESVRNYANLVWGLLPCPVDPFHLAKIQQQYRSDASVI